MSGFFEVIAARKAREALLAAWVIGGASAGARALFTREGEGWTEVCRDELFPAACAEAIGRSSRESAGIVAAAGARLFLESVAPVRRLVICGAGHVSMPVIKIAALLSFEVTVVDDREAFCEMPGPPERTM